MGKNNPSVILKTVFQDISNVENIIKDSKKVEQTYNEIDFENEKDVDKIISDTKTIVDTLKDTVIKIDAYFDENYKTWTNKSSSTAVTEDATKNGVPSNVDDCDHHVEETAFCENENGKNKENDSENIRKNSSTENNKKGSSKSRKNSTESTEIVKVNATSQNENKEQCEDVHENKKSGEEVETEKNVSVEHTNSESSNNVQEDVNTKVDEAENINTVKTPDPEIKNENDASEQRVFLKCVDIKKLMKPDAVLKTPVLPKNDDSVLIISDSDQEMVPNNNKRKNRYSKRVEKDSKKVAGKNSIQKGALKNNSRKVSKRQNQQSKEDVDTVVLDSDSDSTTNNDGRNKKATSNKKSERQLRTRPRNRSKNALHSTHLSDTSSWDDSEDTVNSKKSISKNSKDSEKSRKTKDKVIKRAKKEQLILEAQSDKKFTYKSYVPLPRIPLEKLKEFYLQKKETDEIKRLTNLNNLKKRSRKTSSQETSDQGTSSDAENVKPKPKRKRKTSNNSHSPEDDTTDKESEPTTTTKDLQPNATETVPNQPINDDEVAETVLAGLDSANEASAKDSESEDESKSKKSDKKDSSSKSKKKNKDDMKSASEASAKESESEDESKSKKSDKKGPSLKSKKKNKEDTKSDSEASTKESGAEDESKSKKKESSSNSKEKNKDDQSNNTSDSDSAKKKEKRKWRKDKLLTDKLSETDSEDEFVKFKKRNERAKEDVKARLCKKRTKVISSESDSDSGKKKKNKDEKWTQEETSSSSSSSESEKSDEKEEKANEAKKRSRIKKVKESSSDDEADKSTRKTIRKVIGRDSLAETTKQAEKEEKERKARIAERQKKYNQIFEADKPQNAVVDKVVLDFNEETKEEILAVHEDLVEKLKPHQANGVQFMWDACYESVKRAKKTDGSGCILAHCMGLGKTLQVITLVHTLLMNEKLTGVQKVLVVCPVNTVLNWASEFKKWLDDVDGPEIDVCDLISCRVNDRPYAVKQWSKGGGVLIIGYDMFRNLTNPNNKRIKKSAREMFQQGLVDPGPDLVVCDEGHLLKNEKTNLSISMNRIRTIRRIVLTGTPMQNNLKEYYCMVQFVKPNLLGTYKEYLNRFVNPITNGQYTDSTPHDISIMRKRSHVLHKMLDGIVQRKDYSVLAPFLPAKHEYVLFLTLTETQIKLYQHYRDNYSQRPVEGKIGKSAFLFADFQEFQGICTHPRVLLSKSELKEKKQLLADDDEDSEGSLKDFIDDGDSDEKSTTENSSTSSSDDDDDSAKSDASVKSKGNKKKAHSKARLTRNSAAAAGIDVEKDFPIPTTSGNEWWRQFCDGEELDNIAHSSKLYLLFKILQECEYIGDKLLVFSQSLFSLNVIEYFLGKIDEATQNGDSDKVCGFSGSWALGLDYFRIDGSSSCDSRHAWCKSFNNPENPRARLFLISTRAGGLGINLTGANRVVIFDVSWNPSHDIQSIYRVYRFGQTKPCYIYRFVTWGTMEMKIYERQVTKQAISKRVIDEQQIDRHYNQTDLAELYHFDPKPSEQHTPLVPKDVLLAELLQKEKERMYKYHEHQSLLENKEDEELNEAERKAAWEEYENEKTTRVVNNMGWIKNLPIASISTALMSIVQKDNPTWTPQQIQAVVPQIVQQLREQVDSGEMMLFNRIVNEIKIMQLIQQQKMQEYWMRQQMLRLQNFQGPSTTGGLGDLRNTVQTAFSGQRFLNNPNEVVELND